MVNHLQLESRENFSCLTTGAGRDPSGIAWQVGESA